MKRSMCLAAAVALTASAHAGGPVSTQIARTQTTVTGQPITVPANPEIVASIGTIPPGARIAEHRHPYPRLVYVLDGVLTVTNTETGKTFVRKKGEFVAEMQNTWHYGENKGAVPVKLFVIDEVPKGTKTNLVPRNSRAP